MTEEKTTGLLLQSIPYLGQNRILKVLSPEHGLLSFIAKKNIAPVFTTPFAFAEWVYEKNQRELHALKDASLFDDFGPLKKDYAHLSAAGQMAQDLLRTQLPGKSAQEPLALALACFRKLPLFKEPAILNAVFRLKLLSCEGLVDELPPPLENLLLSRSFSQLASLPKEPRLLAEVDLLFQERLDFSPKKA